MYCVFFNKMSKMCTLSTTSMYFLESRKNSETWRRQQKNQNLKEICKDKNEAVKEKLLRNTRPPVSGIL